MSSILSGLLLTFKANNVSSFGVVAKVRGVWRAQLREHGESIKKAKVGHTGTLDPAATGLMLIVLGSYCKRASEFSKLDKTYEVEMTLGIESSTGDQEGELTNTSSKVPSETGLRKTISGFIGEQQQTPPAFSAVKVNGQRAYKLARAGKEVKIEPRTVHIYDIAEVRYKYPVVHFTVHVSSGTYIRSLVEDMGKALGTGAYMSALKRTRVGSYDIKDAIELEGLTFKKLQTSIRQVTT